MGRSNRYPGRARVKLAELLTKALTESEGFPVYVDPYDLWTQKGDYRKAEWDLARWGVEIRSRRPDGSSMFLNVFSWDRMTDCVRYGFTVTNCSENDFGKSLPGDREITANQTSD